MAVAAATSLLPSVKAPEEGYIQTEPLLAVCKQVLPIIDKLGTAFVLVKSDISGNIQRLADRASLDPTRYNRLFTIIQDEIVDDAHTGSSSCTKGLLWLKRAMEFTVAILRRLVEAPSDTLAKAVADTYSQTLAKYHGFMVSSAFALAFKFVPSREAFLEALQGQGQRPDEVLQQMQLFVQGFSPILADIQQYLADNNLDDPTKV